MCLLTGVLFGYFTILGNLLNCVLIIIIIIVITTSREQNVASLPQDYSASRDFDRFVVLNFFL